MIRPFMTKAAIRCGALGAAIALASFGCREAPAPTKGEEPTAPVPDAPTTIPEAAGKPAPAPPPASDGTYPLDDDPVAATPRRPDGQRRRSRAVELVIRSTPPGATASVDGRPIGATPTYWEGTADGQMHEFTFALPGYVVSRYRFVPTQSGIVHGSLTRLVTPAGDAGPSLEAAKKR